VLYASDVNVFDIEHYGLIFTCIIPLDYERVYRIAMPLELNFNNQIQMNTFGFSLILFYNLSWSRMLVCRRLKEQHRQSRLADKAAS